jgi:hypothetical protein
VDTSLRQLSDARNEEQRLRSLLPLKDGLAVAQQDVQEASGGCDSADEETFWIYLSWRGLGG